jgi:hypothetical protein
VHLSEFFPFRQSGIVSADDFADFAAFAAFADFVDFPPILFGAEDSWRQRQGNLETGKQGNRETSEAAVCAS